MDDRLRFNNADAIRDDGVRIPLYARGGSVRAYALVDADDAAYVTQFRWGLHPGGYAKRRGVYMHRDLLRDELAGMSLEVDHINEDKLDNRRSNLRIVTHGQNVQNITRKRPGAKSRFRNVYWSKDNKKWHVRVVADGVSHNLGYFHDEAEAARVATEARRRLQSHSPERRAA